MYGVIRGFFDLKYIGLSYTPFCYLSDSVFPSIYIVFFAPCYILSIIAVGIFYFLGRNTRLTPSVVDECSLSMNRSWSITIHVIRTMQVFDNMHTCSLEFEVESNRGGKSGCPQSGEVPEKNTTRGARLFRQPRSPLGTGSDLLYTVQHSSPYFSPTSRQQEVQNVKIQGQTFSFVSTCPVTMLSLLRRQIAHKLPRNTRCFSAIEVSGVAGTPAAAPPTPAQSTPSAPSVRSEKREYFVPRNTKGNLPVYTDVRNAGSRHLVLIRNIEGNASVCAIFHLRARLFYSSYATYLPLGACERFEQVTF